MDRKLSFATPRLNTCCCHDALFVSIAAIFIAYKSVIIAVNFQSIIFAIQVNFSIFIFKFTRRYFSCISMIPC